MGLIFSLSTDAGASQNTRPAVGGILRKVFPGLAERLPPKIVDRIDFNLRKTAHVVEYFILAILAYRAFAFGRPTFRHQNVTLPLVFSIAYAVSDEYHQSLTSLREGAATDVTFDFIGIVLGLLCCLWYHCATVAGTRSSVPSSSRP